MHTFKELIAHNLFLAEHAGIKEFTEHFAYHAFNSKLQNPHTKTEQSWSVVCERSEDVSVIREQIMRTLESIYSKPIDISGGISFYTLDQLGRNFCATLALSEDKNIRAIIPKSLFKPYVDVAKQEKIVDFILNLFHFSGQGSSVLAKQILAILDVPLPPDLSIFDAFMDALHLKKKRSYKDISEVFLKQILASLQASRVVLNRYARLQTLVWEFLQTEFSKLIDNADGLGTESRLTPSCLSGSILWIGAPEFADSSSHSKSKNFRPGNFLSPLVDDFLSCILKIRKIFLNQNESVFIHQRTILTNDFKNSSQKDLTNLSFYCAKDAHEFYKILLKYSQSNENSTLVFTGEFDARVFQTTRSDAGGAYKLLKKEFSDWKNKKSDNFFAKELFNQLDEQYDDFLDTASHIENYTKLTEIAKIYSIPIRDFSDNQLDEIFYSFVASEKLEYKQDKRLSHLLKQYSFFSTNSVPKKLVVLWNASHFEKSSFATRLLNQMFSLLQCNGVEIDNPFTEKKFVNFWRHIVGLTEQIPNLKIDIIIDSQDSLDNFPFDLKKKKICSLMDGQVKFSNEQLSMMSKQKISDINLDGSRLKSLFDQIQITQISTTQFESYVKCPFQFFLDHCVKLKKNKNSEIFLVDPQKLGTKVHKICDLLISQMVTKFGNDHYIEKAPNIYERVLSAISPSSIFLNPAKESWKNALSFLPIDEQFIFFESIDEIFESDSMDPVVKPRDDHIQTQDDHIQTRDNKNQMSSVLFIEMCKRAFFKFLHTEVKNMRLGNKRRVGIVREYPFEIKLGELMIRGRIDRIDMNNDGYEIIDYKVSPISNSKKSLCILPIEIQAQKNKSVPSIQGAIYSLAFGKKVFDENRSKEHEEIDSQENETCLSAFSLYRLKNAKEEDNGILTYSFHQKGKQISGREQIQRIENELLPYAKNLENKKFAPNPLLKKHTCEYCTFQNICPYPLQKEDNI